MEPAEISRFYRVFDYEVGQIMPFNHRIFEIVPYRVLRYGVMEFAIPVLGILIGNI